MKRLLPIFSFLFLFLSLSASYIYGVNSDISIKFNNSDSNKVDYYQGGNKLTITFYSTKDVFTVPNGCNINCENYALVIAPPGKDFTNQSSDDIVLGKTANNTKSLSFDTSKGIPGTYKYRLYNQGKVSLNMDDTGRIQAQGTFDIIIDTASITTQPSGNPITIDTGQGDFTLVFKSDKQVFDKNGDYSLLVSQANKEINHQANIVGTSGYQNQDTKDPVNKSDTKLEFTFPNAGRDTQIAGLHKFELWIGRTQTIYQYTGQPGRLLYSGAYKVGYKGGDIALYSACSQVKKGTKVPLYLLNAQVDPNIKTNYSIWLDGEVGVLESKYFTSTEPFVDKKTGTTVQAAKWDIAIPNTFKNGKANLCVEQTADNKLGNAIGLTCRWKLSLELVDREVDPATCNEIQSNTTGITGPVSSGQTVSPTPIPTPILPPCIEGKDSSGKIIAIPTLAPGNTNAETIKTALTQIKKCTKVDSALGAISTDPQGFILWLFRILLSISGGIALLAIIAAGYRYMTSQGNAEAVKAAQEQITSAIVGLLFLVFSMVMLQVIGVDIIQLPGLKASVQVGGNTGNLK
jgi:hypothetical protein